ncbi:hypothetical protein [Flavobacterium sp. CS20]|uniref:hypothetical protein n=1 Tax=Flavobacterium sp. CS20 TaxID=2775246 RepID=UPI001B3A6624|nr:hypothetical protein [Flavobacterium sp. CS20]QTY26631.1 hypothetical protein IGB25_12090 [Flavobacterium sp. CS20]
MPNINASKQSFNTLIILIGAGLLLYDFIAKPNEIYFKIAGLVILMFGLYKSTQQWTSDNKTDDNENSTEEDDKPKNDEA